MATYLCGNATMLHAYDSVGSLDEFHAVGHKQHRLPERTQVAQDALLIDFTSHMRIERREAVVEQVAVVGSGWWPAKNEYMYMSWSSTAPHT